MGVQGQVGTLEGLAYHPPGTGSAPAAPTDAFWLAVRRQLLELPQMRAGDAGPPPPAAQFGRRPAGQKPRASVPALGSGRLAGRLPDFSHGLSRAGLPVRISAPDGHDWFVAGALLAFFALGWLAAMAGGVIS